jgi:hypothetical protein
MAPVLVEINDHILVVGYGEPGEAPVIDVRIPLGAIWESVD